jgi:arabinofuranosyltransferase
MVNQVGKRTWMAIGSLLVLVLSNAFIDYSTSGLENPLSIFLAVLFFGMFFKGTFSLKRIFFLSMLASLAGMNRQDSLLLYFPALLWAWWRSDDKARAMAAGVLGQFPLILWELFSLIYYGWPFPGTYYAKLGNGIPHSKMIAQGMLYYQNSLIKDPITLVAIGLILVIIIGLSVRLDKRWLVGSLGVWVYLAYILWIAGDFMSGRFFMLPLFIAVLFFTQLDGQLPRKWALIIVGGLAAFGLTTIMPTWQLENPNVPARDNLRRVFDARLVYFEEAGLLNQWDQDQNRFINPIPLAQQTLDEYDNFQESSLVLEGAIGYLGYYAGREVLILDHYGLADPLRAQLPSMYAINFRTAHFLRFENIEGYEESVATKINKIKDSGLHTYYDYLYDVISGPIFSPQRLVTIWHLNRGDFDYLIDTFYYRYPEVVTRSYGSINDIKPLPEVCPNDTDLIFKLSGALISVPDHLQHAAGMSIAINDTDDFKILFYLDTELVGEIDSLNLQSYATEAIHEFNIPDKISQKGFDQVHILPITNMNDSRYCLSYLIVH